MFKYFRGEAKNPFNHDRQNAESNFWDYESMFEEKFNAGDFTAESWIPPNAEDQKEWEAVLSGKPVDKEELFKLWIFNLVMDRLPEKYQTESDNFILLYFNARVEKIEDLQHA